MSRRKVATTVYFEADQISRLQALADQSGVSQAEIIRRALGAFLESAIIHPRGFGLVEKETDPK